jgi:hypothetical protein
VRLSITRSPPVRVRLIVFDTVIEALAEDELEAGVSAWTAVITSPEQAVIPTNPEIMSLHLSNFIECILSL